MLSVAFIVDQANISRDGGDFLQPLVFAAIVQANLAGLRHDPQLQRRYANSGETLPDAARRPISISAVAQSLRLPYETVRRRVRRLVDQDLCVLTPNGVYVPRAAILSEHHAAIQASRMRRIERLHDDLTAIGFLAADEAPGGGLAAAPVRAVNTALAQYMLRSCERLIELTGDLVDGFVLLGLAAANGEGLLHAGEAAAPGRVPGQPWRVAASALAARIGMPGETVRRRLPALAAAGHAGRAPNGWMASAPAAEHGRLAQLAAENEADLQRLMARVRSLAAGASN